MNNKDWDHTAQIYRMTQVFVECTCQKVHFLSLQLESTCLLPGKFCTWLELYMSIHPKEPIPDFGPNSVRSVVSCLLTLVICL